MLPSNLSGGVQCLRMTFIVMNIIFGLIGGAIFALGIYLTLEGQEFGETLTGVTFTSGSVLLIVSGAVTLVVTVAGIAGAIGFWTLLLYIYIILVAIIIVLEIVAGSIGFLFRSEIADDIGDRMRDAVRDYRDEGVPDHESEVNSAVDTVQERFDCCGADSPLDWYSLNPNFTIGQNGGNPPSSCSCDLGDGGCATHQYNGTFEGAPFAMTFVTWKEGCINETRDVLEALGYTIGSLGIGIAFIQIFGLVVAIGLLCCILQHDRKKVGICC